MSEVIISSVLEEAFKQVSERVARKLTEGKKLTDTEVIVLLLDLMNRRINDMNVSLNQRIDDTNKRIDDLNTSLNQRIDDTSANLMAKMEELDKRLNQRIDDLNTSLNQRIDDT
ncbi:MAG: hypothetical protein J7L91_00670, partial [Candidatus Korarchaeota archaeon]|nr:hypothetical protein [Candidatus Korarchaeota archaeon]